MAAGLDARLDALLDTIPCAARRPRTVEELPGGLTNRNLKVTTPDGTVVVRIPAAGPGLLGIDRDHEHANSVAAAAAGVGAPVRHYRPGQGLVVDFLPGRTLTDDDLHDPAVLGRVARACRRLHAGPRFARRVRHVRGPGPLPADRRRARVPAAAALRRVRARRRRRAGGARAARLTVPCNNDLLAGNILDDGEQVRIIDYEYSGNNDPCFELGNVWSEATLPLPLLEVLVTAYFGRPRPAQVARARLFGLVSKYGWMLWASIQDGSSPLDFDFWSWGMEKFDRAVAEFDGPDLEHLLRRPQAVPSRHGGPVSWSDTSRETSDEAVLHRLGYAQVLYREMGGFSNFAISFTIISILAGCLTSYYLAFNYGGPVAITWGWLLVGGFCVLVAMAMGEIASAMPTAGALYFWASKLGGPAWGWFTGWFNLIGPDRGDRRDRLRRRDLHDGPAQPVVPGRDRHRHRRRSSSIYTVIVALHLALNVLGVNLLARLNTFSAWWHMIGVLVIVAVLIVRRRAPVGGVRVR